MRCALVQWWMDEYIDGRLSGKRLKWVQAHLQTCRSCAQELAWRRSLHSTHKLAVPAPSSQAMWQEFQQRLAQRTPSVRPRPLPWWQVGTAVAAVTCALAVGVAWWARNPAPLQPISEPGSANRTPSVAKVPPRDGVPTLGAPSSEGKSREPDSRSASDVKAPMRSRPKAPSPQRMVLLRYPTEQSPVQTPTEPAPQTAVSVAYAEVRNAGGELVGKVLVQTTYDETGQPRAVRIEMDRQTTVEVESNEQPMDNPDSYSNTHGSANGTVPAASTPAGISD